MDSRDLIPLIRKSFPVKKEDEVKKAREEFVVSAKKLLEEDFRENYYKIYEKSPDLYKFKS